MRIIKENACKRFVTFLLERRITAYTLSTSLPKDSDLPAKERFSGSGCSEESIEIFDSDRVLGIAPISVSGSSLESSSELFSGLFTIVNFELSIVEFVDDRDDSSRMGKDPTYVLFLL